MARAPFQVLVLPFRRLSGGGSEYAALCPADTGRWQGIAGGGEAGESLYQAAIREAGEEAGLPATVRMYRLQTVSSVPVECFSGRDGWPADLYVIAEYCFAADCTGLGLRLSSEHTAAAWDVYSDTANRLHWRSNKTALWELDQRLRKSDMPRPLEA